MSDVTIADVRGLLREALEERGTPRQEEAVQAVLELLTTLSATAPARLDSLGSGTGDEKPLPFRGEAGIAASLISELSRNLHRIHVLLRIVHPRWINGGERMLDAAPPFAEVKDELMAALDCGVIDFEGFAGILIGRYGPDAREVLPELIERLRRHRKDCSKAPGLTWAVYMVGGVSAAAREVLLEVARGSDSCPHSRPLAIEILAMNEVSID